MTPPSPNQARFFVALLPHRRTAELRLRRLSMRFGKPTEQSCSEIPSPHHPAASVSLATGKNWTRSSNRSFSPLCPQHSPVPITLCGFGAFPPRVIYVNVFLEGVLDDCCSLPSDGLYLARDPWPVDQKSRNRRFAPI
jgi:hypothetical protein